MMMTGPKDSIFSSLLDNEMECTSCNFMGDTKSGGDDEINWEHHTAGTTWARSFLKKLDDNFTEKIIRHLTQKDGLLDLLLVNRVDLMSEVEIGGCLGHSNHKVIEFKISVDRRKSASETSALDMKRADCSGM
ncbi:hypothetical protein WISP_105223 [Willisornis vidua]|uniref:Uncharacterized protein n=1 Tax=Willisornis vidua TaxID=1566151 RepID=A0ABQ9D067_9PASS|nr:hypothetical protein WISP_105223 [Willisornis vidua]